MKHKLESRLLGEISTTPDTQMVPLYWQKMKRNWRASWGCRGEWKSWLKTQKKTKIMTTGLITLWQIEGEKVETFIFLGPKSLWTMTAAMKFKDTYSLEGKLWQT